MRITNANLAAFWQETDSEMVQRMQAMMGLIEWDLPRTFPQLGFFHDGGPMHTGLEKVLLCYVCFYPRIGYVQVRTTFLCFPAAVIYRIKNSNFKYCTNHTFFP